MTCAELINANGVEKTETKSELVICGTGNEKPRGKTKKRGRG